jgi:hypothetical protein
VVRIALFGDSGCVRVEVFAQRALAKPFNRSWEGEEFIYHPSRVPSDVERLCRHAVTKMLLIGR